MKEIVIDQHCSQESALAELNRFFMNQPDSYLRSAVHKKALECLHANFTRLDSIAQAGTTVDIRQTFQIERSKIVIRLRHPARVSLMDKVTALLRIRQ